MTPPKGVRVVLRGVRIVVQTGHVDPFVFPFLLNRGATFPLGDLSISGLFSGVLTDDQDAEWPAGVYLVIYREDVDPPQCAGCSCSLSDDLCTDAIYLAAGSSGTMSFSGGTMSENSWSVALIRDDTAATVASVSVPGYGLPAANPSCDQYTYHLLDPEGHPVDGANWIVAEEETPGQGFEAMGGCTPISGWTCTGDCVCDAAEAASVDDCNGVCDPHDDDDSPDCDGVCNVGEPASAVDCDGPCDEGDEAWSPDCP